MQIEKMEKKHYDFLAKELEMTAEKFDEIANSSDKADRLKLIDDLTWIECDEIEACEDKEYSERGQTASELIDIICGPYDPDEINEPDEEEEESA